MTPVILVLSYYFNMQLSMAVENPGPRLPGCEPPLHALEQLASPLSASVCPSGKWKYCLYWPQRLLVGIKWPHMYTHTGQGLPLSKSLCYCSSPAASLGRAGERGCVLGVDALTLLFGEIHLSIFREQCTFINKLHQAFTVASWWTEGTKNKA